MMKQYASDLCPAADAPWGCLPQTQRQLCYRVCRNRSGNCACRSFPRNNDEDDRSQNEENTQRCKSRSDRGRTSSKKQASQEFQQGSLSSAGIHSLGCALTAVLQASESSAWWSCKQPRSFPLPRGALAQNFCASAEQAPRSAPLPVLGCVVCATAVPANKTAATAMMRRSTLMRPPLVSVYRGLTIRWESIRRPATRQAVRCRSDRTIPRRQFSIRHQAVRGVAAMAPRWPCNGIAISADQLCA